MKFVPWVATYETLWKTPTTLICKSTWRVYGLWINFNASGFPVIIKFQPATCKTYLPKGNQLVEWKRSENIALSTTDILYGYKPESNIFTSSIIMSLLQNIKSFFRSWTKPLPALKFSAFYLMAVNILCERTIAFKNNTLRKFRAKWRTLCTWAVSNNFVSGDVPPLRFYFPYCK